MGTLIMWNVVTLDGYFEGTAPWDLPWHEPLWSEDLEAFSLEQLQNAEALLFGRMTYEGMYAYWSQETGPIADLMNSLPKLVASRTLQTVEWSPSRLLGKNLIQEIEDIKKAATKDLYVFGSSNLLRTLIEANLVDEYRMGIAPHWHGRGRRLFDLGIPERDLELVAVKQVRNHGVILTYRPRK